MVHFSPKQTTTSQQNKLCLWGLTNILSFVKTSKRLNSKCFKSSIAYGVSFFSLLSTCLCDTRPVDIIKSASRDEAALESVSSHTSSPWPCRWFSGFPSFHFCLIPTAADWESPTRASVVEMLLPSRLTIIYLPISVSPRSSRLPIFSLSNTLTLRTKCWLAAW